MGRGSSLHYLLLLHVILILLSRQLLFDFINHTWLLFLFTPRLTATLLSVSGELLLLSRNLLFDFIYHSRLLPLFTSTTLSLITLPSLIFLLFAEHTAVLVCWLRHLNNE
nr:dehydrin family protein DHN1 [Pinus tabuliformis]